MPEPLRDTRLRPYVGPHRDRRHPRPGAAGDPGRGATSVFGPRAARAASARPAGAFRLHSSAPHPAVRPTRTPAIWPPRRGWCQFRGTRVVAPATCTGPSAIADVYAGSLTCRRRPASSAKPKQGLLPQEARQGRKRVQAVIALARRRASVLVGPPARQPSFAPLAPTRQ
ncbi:hypothetical protein SAFG77S_01143 [Streptomyces afghaniensis]